MDDLLILPVYGIRYYLESLFLLLCLFGAVGISTSYYNWRKGSNVNDSVNSGLMVILLLVGLMLFYAGAVFVGVSSNTSNSGLNATNQDNPEYQRDWLANNGWGLLGFGISLFSISIAFICNIESQRTLDQLKNFLYNHRRIRKKYPQILDPRDLMDIAAIWTTFAGLTSAYCLLYPTIMTIFPMGVAVLMDIIAASIVLLAIHRKCGIIQWIFNQIAAYCIFCYLFPILYDQHGKPKGKSFFPLPKRRAQLK